MLLLPAVGSICSGPRLGFAREYGSVMVDQKIVSHHEKCAIFVIATNSSDSFAVGFSFRAALAAESGSVNPVRN
jgi:hypothetical protein